MKYEEMKLNLIAKAEECNALMKAGKLEERSSKLTALKDLVKDANKASEVETIIALRDYDLPILEAVRRGDKAVGTYEVCKVSIDEDDPENTVTIEQGSKEIRLLKLDKDLKKLNVKAGNAATWVATAEKLNIALTARLIGSLTERKNQEILTRLCDTYFTRSIINKTDLGKDPTSNTQLMKMLTSVIEEMIGPDYKPVKQDLNAILEVYGTVDRKDHSKVKAMKLDALVSRLGDICNRLVYGWLWDATYKQKKEK